LAENGKRLELSDHVQFRIRLAHRQGLLSQGGESSRLQQWALAWLIREEDNEKIRLINDDRENLFKTILLAMKPDVYNQVFGKNEIEDTDVGEDFSPDDLSDVDAFLKGKRTMTAADILNNGDWL
jgi:hypothetical protein